MPNLKLSKNAKIIIIGSTLGLQNHNKKEVIYSATKFAMRGIIHSLRTQVRDHYVGVTGINLGDLATQYEYEEGTEIVSDTTKGTQRLSQKYDDNENKQQGGEIKRPGPPGFAKFLSRH